ncbi:MAG: hypothetical protein RSG22_05670 [Comamonas sp.]
MTLDVADSTTGAGPYPSATTVATPVLANSVWMRILSALAMLMAAWGVYRR